MYKKIDLDYDFNALEPYIDKETLETHYSKHLNTYLDKLNTAMKDYEHLTKESSLEKLLTEYINQVPENIRQDVINNGGGVYKHNLYFYNLSPNPQKTPDGKLLEKIEKAFGSFEKLKEEMIQKGISLFGSGYVSLAMDKDKNLCITQTKNQDTTLAEGLTPILTIDVWEHSYYLKYKNLRADYLKNIWNVIDFKKVASLYDK